MTTPSSHIIASQEEIRRALTFFKVMAVVVGIGLLVLVLEMILKYGVGLQGRDNPLWWWPQPHGFLYMVYAVATFFLSLKVRWPLGKLIWVLLAGCIPFLSFVAEAKVVGEVRALMAEREQSAGLRM
ncbi:integral membrane protein [Austwickia chelonae]|uniref:DUF3817 domain-containing protein n=1 Tax=Austwickia chelonae NBRC 105200 TaxID=1184607 RepID=K6V404_9MICO|nr:DUF3817 domain-containing protein [Austwickia chelonae]GAB76868.1 hypothetical protein AUCHE_03_00850 [Austwickia chelonae NBRC 105200]SEW31771.1 integral membrane protein [Austwickia chelonae]